MLKKTFLSPSVLILIALVLGLICGLSDVACVHGAAGVVSDIFVRFLKLVSVPLVFLSVASTLSSLEGFEEVRLLGFRVIRYTLLTTLIAGCIALGLFLAIRPSASIPAVGASMGQVVYGDFLMGLIPENFVKAFLDNNVLGVMIIAFLFGGSALSLGGEKKVFLNRLFSHLFDMVIRATSFILIFMPLAVWAFVTLFFRDARAGAQLGELFWYFVTVVGANLLQAFVVLPLLLRIKGCSPLGVFQAYMPALVIAFFSKSSNAALPTSIQCAQERLGLSKKVSNFSLPLCATCNMNACAGFILITVLFVAGSHGVVFGPLELLAWVVFATIAAIGNAGVPMGCYFLSSAFLVAIDVPLNIMGLILPLYAIIDMIETAVNVWSDGVITAVVDKDLSA